MISPGIEAGPPGLSEAWAGRRDLGHNEGGHPDNSDCDTNSFITTSTSIAGGKKIFFIQLFFLLFFLILDLLYKQNSTRSVGQGLHAS